jgi:uncharacterized protein YqiB (DUF1249 family)
MLGSACRRESRVLADSMIVPQCIHRPGSFTGLMTMYESNYLKFRLLTDTIPPTAEAEALVSRVPGDCDLHLSTVRREPYTTTLKLTYWFTESDSGDALHVPDPDLTVRIYHDARLVEGVGGQRFHRHPVLRDLAVEHSAELDRRWQINIMLNKWLDYLLERGHSFR